ncbi:hypothetical protein evm_010013 [Chilo suppressalis]|nr:hypothetical protein evm_010013 [Chilo suppressalis]
MFRFKAGRCSRYQFECRRGGECIAVYNACDGVPQCADGSDEAPELGCPAAAAAAAPKPAPFAPPQPTPGAPPVPTAPPHHYTPSPPPPPPPPQIKPMQVLGEPVDSESSLSALEGGEQQGGAAEERWPHRLTQAQPPAHRYNGTR